MSHDIRAVLWTVVPTAVKHAARRQASSDRRVTTSTETISIAAWPALKALLLPTLTSVSTSNFFVFFLFFPTLVFKSFKNNNNNNNNNTFVAYSALRSEDTEALAAQEE